MHALKMEEDSYVHIKLSSNRPNTIYWTHEAVGSLTNFSNLDFVLPPGTKGDELTMMKQVVIFYDDIDGCDRLAEYLDSHLPAALRHTGIVRHYHSEMSDRYLKKMLECFESGECKILIGTSGIATGLNLRGLAVAIVYGVTRDVASLLQRGGRVGRTEEAEALVLVIYEPWIRTAEIPPSLCDPLSLPNPDQALVTVPVDKKPTKQQRTGVAVYYLFRNPALCLHRFFHPEYLNDTSQQALSVTASVCCSSSECVESTAFDPSTFFLGQIGKPVQAHEKVARKAPSLTRPKTNATILKTSLEKWVREHRSFGTSMVMGMTWILNSNGIKTLSKADPALLDGPEAITSILNETDEFKVTYATEIWEIIKNHNQVHPVICRGQRKANTKVRVATRGKENELDDDFVYSDDFWSSDGGDVRHDGDVAVEEETRVVLGFRDLNENTAKTMRQKALLAKKIERAKNV
jgi:hypothetical protein